MAITTLPVLLPAFALYAGSFVFLVWFIKVKILIPKHKCMIDLLEKTSRSALFGPLRKVPGPALNRWTQLPLFGAAVQQRKVYYIDSLHGRYGPVVRTGPYDISFSGIQAVKAIHKVGSGFVKSEFYASLQLRGTLVCIIPTKEHAARRKHFARAFSQQNLMEWDSVITTKVEKTVAKIIETGIAGAEVDILAPFTEMATDIIAELCLGDSFKSGSSLHGRDQKRDAVLNSIRSEILVPQSKVLRNLPFHIRHLPVPILRWILRNAIKAEELETLRREKLIRSTEDKHTLLSTALAENEEGVGLPDDIIVKEAKAFIVAGTDTTAVTITYLIWAVLKHADVKTQLQEEVESLPENFSIADVQKLKYLHLVISEALRLYGSVSGSLPRATPKGGSWLGEYFVPEGTTVTTQSFTVHRNPDIFRDPLKFIPERWTNPTQEMKEAFMPFGIGARACIGMQIAQIEVALAAAIFFRQCPNAALSNSMKDEDMELGDKFVMSPRGNKCMVVL